MHRVYKIQGDSAISIEAPENYLERRYSDPIKGQYPDRKERDKVKPDFHFSFGVESVEGDWGLDQQKINKVPEGLSGYDAHVVEIDMIRRS